jgi:site-specific recombinase XerD
VCFHGEEVRLRAFIKAVGDVELEKISPGAVRRYVDGTGPVTRNWFCKYHTLTGFYRFAINRQFVGRSPLPTSKPQEPPEFVPYIYSQEDMRALLDAVDARHQSDWLVEPRTMRTLLLLLYAAGLRPSEPLRLNVADVDLGEGILTIRETKFHKTRLVPVGSDMLGVLRRYRDRQHDRRGRAPDDPFLVNCKGQRILLQTAELVFKRIREQAGIRRPPGTSYQPRLHDFRHTFAMTRLITWYREGKNVQRLLPHLATYLGHRSVRETQRYLNMTSELLQQAGLRFLKYAIGPGGA